MILYGEELVLKARNMAKVIHDGQVYGNVHSYMKHLEDVHDVLIRFGFENDYNRRAAAYLHDSVEDQKNRITLEDITLELNIDVARFVEAVTDAEGTRKERRLGLFKRMAVFPNGIPLKLADRIANSEYSLVTHSKLDMYLKEYGEFSRKIKPHSTVEWRKMWFHLDYLMEVGRVAIRVAERQVKEQLSSTY